MSTEIRQSELRNDNAVIMRRVAEGESFVVTVKGRPVADVVPHQRATGRRRLVPTAAAIAALSATEMSKSETDRWAMDIRKDADIPNDPWTLRPSR